MNELTVDSWKHSMVRIFFGTFKKGRNKEAKNGGKIVICKKSACLAMYHRHTQFKMSWCRSAPTSRSEVPSRIYSIFSSKFESFLISLPHKASAICTNLMIEVLSEFVPHKMAFEEILHYICCYCQFLNKFN